MTEIRKSPFKSNWPKTRSFEERWLKNGLLTACTSGPVHHFTVKGTRWTKRKESNISHNRDVIK